MAVTLKSDSQPDLHGKNSTEDMLSSSRKSTSSLLPRKQKLLSRHLLRMHSISHTPTVQANKQKITKTKENVRCLYDNGESILEKYIEIEDDLTCREIIPLLVREFKLESNQGLTLKDLYLVQVTDEGEKIFPPEVQPIPLHILDRSQQPTYLTVKNRSTVSRRTKSNPTKSQTNYKKRRISFPESRFYSLNSSMNIESCQNESMSNIKTLERQSIDDNYLQNIDRSNQAPRSKSMSISNTFKNFKSKMRKGVTSCPESDDVVLEYEKPNRKFKTLPLHSHNNDDVDPNTFYIPIHICIEELNTSQPNTPFKLALTHDLTVDLALDKLLIKHGIDKEQHESYGIYEVPLTGSLDNRKSTAWEDNNVKRLDGEEKLQSLYELRRNSPSISRRFELRRHPPVLRSNAQDINLTKRYRTVNFGKDYYEEKKTNSQIQESDILLDDATDIVQSSEKEIDRTEIETTNKMEFVSESKAQLLNEEQCNESLNEYMNTHKIPLNYPFLLNLHSYPLLTSLIIHLNDLVVFIGSKFQKEHLSECSTFVVISGKDIRPSHCRISFTQNSSGELPFKMNLEPLTDAVVMVNNKIITRTTLVQPGDIIQLGSQHVFMYRNPIFEHFHPTYKLPWVPQTEHIITEKALSDTCKEDPILSPPHKLVRSKRFSSRSSDCLPILSQNYPSTDTDPNSNDYDDSYFDDDEDDDYDTDVLSKTKHFFVDSSRFEVLLPFITSGFDMHSKENKSIPSAMLAIGLEHTYSESIESAIEYLTATTKQLIRTIEASVIRLNDLKTHFIFPSQASSIFNNVSYEYEATLHWLNSSLDLCNYPQLYLNYCQSSIVNIALPNKIQDLTEQFKTNIRSSYISLIKHFHKILQVPVSGLIDEHHSVSSLSPCSTSTETSGYLSGNTPTHITHLQAASAIITSTQNPNIELVIDLFRSFYKILTNACTDPTLIEQIFTYLFSLMKHFLVNFILEHGEELRFFSQKRGKQIRYNLDQVKQWATRSRLGMSYSSTLPSIPLDSILDLLSLSSDEIIDNDWNHLRKEFSNISPSQLHHILMHYAIPGTPGATDLPGSTMLETAAGIPTKLNMLVTPEHWRPSITEADLAFNQDNIKESLPKLPLDLPDQPYKLYPRNCHSLVDNFNSYIEDLENKLYRPYIQSASESDSKTATPKNSFPTSSKTVSPYLQYTSTTNNQRVGEICDDSIVIKRRFKSFDDILLPSQYDTDSNCNLIRFQDEQNSSIFIENSDSSLYNSTCNIDDGQLSTASDESLNLDKHMDHLYLTTNKLERPKSLDILNYIGNITIKKSKCSNSEDNITDSSSNKNNILFTSKSSSSISPNLNFHSQQLLNHASSDAAENRSSNSSEQDIIKLLGTSEDTSSSCDELNEEINNSKKNRCTTTYNFTIANKPISRKFKSGTAKSTAVKIDPEEELKAEKHKVLLSTSLESSDDEDDAEIKSSTIIRLAKDPVKGFGIEVVDGSLTRERFPGVYVSSIKYGSPASKCHDLNIGYKVVSINREKLANKGHIRATKLLQDTEEEITLRVLPCDANFTYYQI